MTSLFDDEPEDDGAPPNVDPITGEVHGGDAAPGECSRCAAMEQTVASTKRALQGAERDVRAKNSRIGALEAELEKQRQEDPESQTVKSIYRYWIEKTGRNPKRCKLGGKRQKAILARLHEGYRSYDLMRAIDGAVLSANANPKETQRQALLLTLRKARELAEADVAAELERIYRAAMNGAMVYDDLDLICRDEVNVERFRGVAFRLDPKPDDQRDDV